MNPKWRNRLIVALAAVFLASAIYLPILRRRLKRAARAQTLSEEQARRELLQAALAAPGEPKVKARLFWASSEGESALAPVTIELPLSSDPVLRAKQVLNTLLAGPVDSDLRTLPQDSALLEFYLLPDGTGVADFSEAMGTSLPSGIDSEKLAIDSITRTLEANVPQVRRLKILIHGQEMDTLAGHVDLTGTFLVNPKALPVKLTPAATPGTLSQPSRKP
jgi:hypothetical protein